MSQLSIQVAPYIKKYIDVRLGHPVTLHNKTTTHILLNAMLFQASQLSFFHQQPPHKLLPCTVTIQAASHCHIAARDINNKIRIVNQFFENLFIEEMHTYICAQKIFINRRKGPHNIKHQLEQFCNQYNIITEEDITQDALVKMYYRYRRWLTAANCPLPAKEQSQTLANAV